MKNFLLIIGLAFLCSIGEIYAQYDSTEVAKLRYFLLQESAEEGVKNYQQLGIENIDSVEWSLVPGLSFNNLTHLLERLDWAGEKLSGKADFSNFKALKYLYLSFNSLSLIDVENATTLINLDLYNNSLDSINVETNANLSYLRLGFNNLKRVDVSNNPNLTFFCCTNNSVDSLDLSGKNFLVTANCMYNELKFVNITNCPKLRNFTVYGNRLDDLSLAGLGSLSSFTCSYNNLSKLDLSDCVSLNKLVCYENILTDLDFSYCKDIDTIDCKNNNIRNLNLNGASKLRALCCSDNQLDFLNIDDCENISYIDCKNNNLSYLTLPEITESIDSYIYFPQNSISFDAAYDSVDVSYIDEINGVKSTYTWNKGLNLVRPIKNDNGLFSFEESMVGTTLICRVQNSSFPSLVMRYNVVLKNKDFVGNLFVTNSDISIFGGSGCVYINAASATDVYIYSLSGLLVMEKHVEEGRTVLNLPRGLYVVKAGVGDGFKVVVK